MIFMLKSILYYNNYIFITKHYEKIVWSKKNWDFNTHSIIVKDNLFSRNNFILKWLFCRLYLLKQISIEHKNGSVIDKKTIQYYVPTTSSFNKNICSFSMLIKYARQPHKKRRLSVREKDWIQCFQNQPLRKTLSLDQLF